ncbi:LysR family transcriptional regulator, partial [Stappia sp. TSB10GB4]|uniref:LysR family transcriptional regulator n=1 Tax=Stappia sp. TSB10GB4 TaxID=2003584 RepID=UPI001645DD22
MSRSEINRAREMEVFAQVVDQGGFSAAARVCRMTPSAVSKLVARLEVRLGARLVNRSTRALQLTPEGCAFYERVTRILADIEDAERGASAGEQPVGRIRLNTSASYATHILAPILPEFLDRHQLISLRWSLVLALRMTTIFRMRAVRATIGFFPFAISLWKT